MDRSMPGLITLLLESDLLLLPQLLKKIWAVLPPISPFMLSVNLMYLCSVCISRFSLCRRRHTELLPLMARSHPAVHCSAEQLGNSCRRLLYHYGVPGSIFSSSGSMSRSLRPGTSCIIPLGTKSQAQKSQLQSLTSSRKPSHHWWVVKMTCRTCTSHN